MLNRYNQIGDKPQSGSKPLIAVILQSLPSSVKQNYFSGIMKELNRSNFNNSVCLSSSVGGWQEAGKQHRKTRSQVCIFLFGIFFSGSLFHLYSFSVCSQETLLPVNMNRTHHFKGQLTSQCCWNLNSWFKPLDLQSNLTGIIVILYMS